MRVPGLNASLPAPGDIGWSSHKERSGTVPVHYQATQRKSLRLLVQQPSWCPRCAFAHGISSHAVLMVHAPSIAICETMTPFPEGIASWSR